MSVTSACADFTLGLKIADVPADAVKWAKWGILDCTGVALAGSATETSAIINNYLEFVGGNPQARVLGLGVKTSAPEAAMANGTLAHALDYDDMNRSMLGHPSSVLTAALLPLAESLQLPGRKVLEAYVVGLEAMAQIGRAHV